MFESRHRSSGGSSANRWLIVAGAGLVILAFVARMLLDIGHTKVSDLTGVLRPDSTPAPAAAPAVPAPDTAAPAMPAPTTLDTGSQGEVPPTVTPTPPPVPAVSAPAAVKTAAGGDYRIQIGAFGSEGNATKLSQRTAALGYRSAVVPQARSGSTLYLVRVTGSGTPDDARQASDSLARALGVKAVVLPNGQ